MINLARYLDCIELEPYEEIVGEFAGSKSLGGKVTLKVAQTRILILPVKAAKALDSIKIGSRISVLRVEGGRLIVRHLKNGRRNDSLRRSPEESSVWRTDYKTEESTSMQEVVF